MQPSSARVAQLNSWHANWQGLRVSVCGLGLSGFAAADTLIELGAAVQVVAGNPDSDRERLLKILGAEFVCGDAKAQLDAICQWQPQLLVVSPGYSPSHPVLAWASANQIPVWTEIDLAWRVRDKHAKVADWICVTGTNGKTTTTELTAHMLHAAGYRTAPVGNIGVPVLDVIRDPNPYDVLVVELSSHQLHYTTQIVPYASVVLNLDADHLAWHGDFAGYAAAKAKIYERTQVACVYNRADKRIEQMVANADVKEGARAVSFGLDAPPVAGLGVVDGILADRGYHAERRSSALELMTLEELAAHNLAQPHLVANILAAAALARAYGVAPEQIAQAVLDFQVAKHRLELVAVHNEISWVDDSKATNKHAANAALNSYGQVVWLVGGDTKGVDLSDLVLSHKQRLRAVITLGAEQDLLLQMLAENAPEVPVFDTRGKADPLPVAVAAAAACAQPGDTVLLAPAAAATDQFRNYAERGQKFAQAVQEMLAAS